MTRQPFDVAAPLPPGVVAIEASAGTGKTWAMAALATRLVAEGACTLDELLVVTFARSATRELRHRVRERLADAVDLLDGLRTGPHPAACDDALHVHLASSDVAARDAMSARLQHALADFDRATITTIHAFGAELLRVLGGVAAGTLIESTTALEEEITADARLQLARTEGIDLAALPWKGAASEIVRAAIALRGTSVVPAAGPHDTAGLRAELAARAAAEFTARTRQRRQHTHDDVLTSLLELLADPVRGAAAAVRLRERFRVGLVDEFQDTDPVQWAILQRLFVGGDRLLVVVADPKQAIYAFRGADVHTYVRAAATAGAAYGLEVNRRSDARLVEAVGHLFRTADFGEGIEAPDVAAHHGERLTGLGAAPLVLRLVGDDVEIHRTGAGKPAVGPARELVACDVAAEVVRTLEAGAALAVHGSDPCVVAPRDIAVLVRTNAQAALVQRALLAAGVPAVLNGVGDVLGTDAARDWLRLLEALERPADGGRARLAALGALVGWGVERVATAPDDAWDQLHVQLHRWARTLRDHGAAALHRRTEVDTGVHARLLGTEGGRRSLADLDHVAELLHRAATTEGLGPAALAGWLRAGMADAAEHPVEARARRLESDADAVQILTVHASKGLQFPVVLCPYLWDGSSRTPDAFAFHADGTGERTLDVGGKVGRGGEHAAHLQTWRAETAAEERRLAYVAVTRAQCRAVLWWMEAGSSDKAPLTSVLFPAGPRGGHPARVAACEELAVRSGGVFAFEEVRGSVAPARWEPAAGATPDLAAGTFDRALDRTWRRTSYSALVADAHSRAEEDQRATLDEPQPDPDAPDGPAAGTTASAVPTAVGSPPDAALDAVVPLDAMPGGADVGSAVHELLETTEFDVEDLETVLEDGVRRVAQRFAVDLGDPAATATGLAAALRTPLGPLAGDAPLEAFARADRLDEMAFELPVAGGDRATSKVLLADLADLLDAHLAGDDPLAGYGAVLRRSLGDVAARGYLAGRIDLLLRTSGADRRYLVADHKTNRLGAAEDGPLRARHYTRARMADAMVRNHYPVQALVYVVAVHRFLRWRLGARYDAERDLGGVLYLFLRGMTGPGAAVDDGHPTGVFAWRPPTALVLAFDDLLRAGGAA